MMWLIVNFAFFFFPPLFLVYLLAPSFLPSLQSHSVSHAPPAPHPTLPLLSSVAVAKTGRCAAITLIGCDFFIYMTSAQRSWEPTACSLLPSCSSAGQALPEVLQIWEGEPWGAGVGDNGVWAGWWLGWDVGLVLSSLVLPTCDSGWFWFRSRGEP